MVYYPPGTPYVPGETPIGPGGYDVPDAPIPDISAPGGGEWLPLTTEQWKSVQEQQRTRRGELLIPREQAVAGLSPGAFQKFYEQATPEERKELLRGTRLKVQIEREPIKPIKLISEIRRDPYKKYGAEYEYKKPEERIEIKAPEEKGLIKETVALTGWVLKTPYEILAKKPGVKAIETQQKIMKEFYTGEFALRHPYISGAGGYVERGLDIPKFALKHPVITTGVILAPGLGVKVVGAKVVSTAMIGIGGVTTYFGTGKVIEATKLEQELKSYEIGKGVFDITAGLGTMYLGARGLISKPKVKVIETEALAKETLRMDKTSYYDILAKSRVSVKGILKKPKFYDVEIKGEGVVSPLGDPYYLARGRFASRLLGKKEIISIGESGEIIKVGKPFIKSVGATKVYTKGKVFRFVSAKLGFKVGKVPTYEPTKIPDVKIMRKPFADIWASYGKYVEILKKGEVGKPVSTRVLTIVKRLPTQETQDFGFGMAYKQIVKPKTPKVVTKKFTATIEQLAKATVSRVAIKPKPIPIAYPLAVKELLKSEYEATGLYERTEGGLLPGERVTLDKSLLKRDISRAIKIKPTKDYRKLISSITKDLQKQVYISKEATKLKPLVKEKERVGYLARSIEKQMIGYKNLYRSLAKTLSPQKQLLRTKLSLYGAYPIMPTLTKPIIPPIKYWSIRPGERRKPYPKRKKGIRDLYYIPDFTSKALGIDYIFSRKQMQQLLRIKFSGLELRPGVRF